MQRQNFSSENSHLYLSDSLNSKELKKINQSPSWNTNIKLELKKEIKLPPNDPYKFKNNFYSNNSREYRAIKTERYEIRNKVIKARSPVKVIKVNKPSKPFNSWLNQYYSYSLKNSRNHFQYNSNNNFKNKQNNMGERYSNSSLRYSNHISITAPDTDRRLKGNYQNPKNFMLPSSYYENEKETCFQENFSSGRRKFLS